MTAIATSTGKVLDYINTDIDNINIEDIARGLANECRFSGQIKHFYSVAQHSVLCSYIVPSKFALEALLHDASEAYCKDIPTPLKALLPKYKSIELGIEGLIRLVFGLPNKESPEVKLADLVMLKTEKRDLNVPESYHDVRLDNIIARPDFNIKPVMPDTAYSVFMYRFAELVHDVNCLNFSPLVISRLGDIPLRFEY